MGLNCLNSSYLTGESVGGRLPSTQRKVGSFPGSLENLCGYEALTRLSSRIDGACQGILP